MSQLLMRTERLGSYKTRLKASIFSVRTKVCTIVVTDPFYTKKNIYSDFMRGVLGVLQGGLESAELADRDSIDLYHNHTINDIIEECKNRREFEDGNM